MTTTQTRRPAKARAKPSRAIRLLLRAAGNQPTIVRITVDRKAALYAVREIVSEIGGRGFEVREISTEETETYQVLVDKLGRSCTCLGCQQHGACKHADGIAKLVADKIL